MAEVKRDSDKSDVSSELNHGSNSQLVRVSSRRRIKSDSNYRYILQIVEDKIFIKKISRIFKHERILRY